MLMTLASIKHHVRFNPSKPSIDNIVFKMHYRATFLFLLTATILVCSREYFGQHITCIADAGVAPHVIQTYCFFTSTFTIVRHYNESLLAAGVLPHPGVGPQLPHEETRHHAYYQWVPFLLFGQAIMFYMPHYIWRKKEGGRVKALVDGLQLAGLALGRHDLSVSGGTVPSKDSFLHRLDIIRRDIILRLKASRTWSTWMVAMEVANLLNVVLQVYVTNRFLNGLFLSLGPQMLTADWTQRMDPLDTVFPKVTKCLFHKYGPSGSIQQHDALCVMALNVINEKIYAFLWFWYLLLFIASLLGVIWRVVTFLMFRRSARFNEYLFQSGRGAKFNSWSVLQVVRGCEFADWLFLYYLAANMNGFVFRELFTRLAEELEKQEEAGDGEGRGGAVLIKHALLDEESALLPPAPAPAPTPAPPYHDKDK